MRFSEQYKEFYKQTTLDFEDPLLHTHMITHAPVQLYALLYIPSKMERGLFALRKDDGLRLYSRNILIDEYNKDLLPEYLRFVQSVVDSEDLPLNVSRETVQSSGLMPKLKKVLTNQVLRDLEGLAKNNSEKYLTFWQECGGYIKQGLSSFSAEAEKLQGLLRFKTNLNPETWSSLEDYMSRMKEGQKVIYYIVGDDPKSVLRSPHLDYFQSQGTEVMLLTEPMDSFMLMGLRQYKDHELKNVAQAEIENVEKPREEVEAEKIPDAVRYYPEDFGEPEVRVLHMDLFFDIFDEHTFVSSSLRAEVLDTPLNQLVLNAKELEILSVSCDASLVTYTYDREASLLSLFFEQELPPGCRFTISTETVCYPSDHVLEGLYYDRTPPGAPPTQITQCQQWGFQRLVPCIDTMDAKCTYTTTIVADERYTCLVSNGDVSVPRTPVENGRASITYDNSVTPMAPYLFFLGVGSWEIFPREFEYPDGKKFRLELLVPPGSEAVVANYALQVLADCILWLYLYTATPEPAGPP